MERTGHLESAQDQEGEGSCQQSLDQKSPGTFPKHSEDNASFKPKSGASIRTDFIEQREEKSDDLKCRVDNKVDHQNKTEEEETKEVKPETVDINYQSKKRFEKQERKKEEAIGKVDSKKPDLMQIPRDFVELVL